MRPKLLVGAVGVVEAVAGPMVVVGAEAMVVGAPPMAAVGHGVAGGIGHPVAAEAGAAMKATAAAAPTPTTTVVVARIQTIRAAVAIPAKAAAVTVRRPRKNPANTTQQTINRRIPMMTEMPEGMPN